MGMNEKIITEIRKIEFKEGVKVMYAVESGSRAWGIESIDSDYDVRGFFIQDPEKYLSLDSIKAQGKVIEFMSEDKKVDMVLFDLFKFLRLVSNSNPSCIEWVKSPTFYYGMYPTNLHAFVDKHINWLSLFHHYASLCRENYKKYISSGKDITTKRYLYCMRGLLNAKYVAHFKKAPPNDLKVVAEILLNVKEINGHVAVCMENAIYNKKRGEEQQPSQQIEILDTAIANFLDKEVKSVNVNPVPLSKEGKELLNYYPKQITKWWGLDR